MRKEDYKKLIDEYTDQEVLGLLEHLVKKGLLLTNETETQDANYIVGRVQAYLTEANQVIELYYQKKYGLKPLTVV